MSRDVSPPREGRQSYKEPSCSRYQSQTRYASPPRESSRSRFQLGDRDESQPRGRRHSFSGSRPPSRATSSMRESRDYDGQSESYEERLPRLRRRGTYNEGGGPPQLRRTETYFGEGPSRQYDEHPATDREGGQYDADGSYQGMHNIKNGVDTDIRFLRERFDRQAVPKERAPDANPFDPSPQHRFESSNRKPFKK